VSVSDATNGHGQREALFIGGDSPIQSRGADLLSRAKLATVVAGHLRVIDATQGAVVGLWGPWGVGKTSLLHMIAESLADEPAVPVAHFNPWLFSGAEQLTGRFLSEIAAQLRDQESALPITTGRVAVISGQLERYGEALSPMVGALPKAEKSITTQRDELAKELAKLELPVVVIIDDIDRLQPHDMRDVFRLIRLTASFPNLIYLLAFDRRRVESALGDDQPEGRAYLETIVQLMVEVPPVPRVQLVSLLLDRLEKVLERERSVGRLHEDRWPDILHRVVAPLIASACDVKRYIASLPAMINSVGGEIALEDVLTLQAVRVLLPDVHAQLPKAALALTTVSSSIGRDPNAEIHARAIQAFVESGGNRSSVVRELCELLFPASLRYLDGTSYGEDWLAAWGRRSLVAHPDVLALYIDRLHGESVAPARAVEDAFEALTDAEALRSVTSDLDPDQLEDLLVRLEDHEGDLPPEAASQATPLILDAYPRLHAETRGLPGFGPRLVVARLVLRLLRRIDSEDDRVTAIFEVFDSTRSLAGKGELTRLVGHRENAGHRLVSAEAAERLEGKLREAIITAPPEELATEHNILELMSFAGEALAEKARPQAEERLRERIHDPTVAAALLRDAVREAYPQPVGIAQRAPEERLDWDALVSLYGSEQEVRDVLDTLVKPKLEKAQDDRLSRAVGLAERYLTGSRPEDL
jgi:KAP family P-loop domain